MIDVTYEPQQLYVPPTGNCKNNEEEFVQCFMEEKKDDFYDDMLLIGLITIALLVALFTIAKFEGETTFKDTPSFLKDATTFTDAEKERLTHAGEESSEDFAYLHSKPDLSSMTSNVAYFRPEDGEKNLTASERCSRLHEDNCESDGFESFDYCEWISKDNKCVDTSANIEKAQASYEQCSSFGRTSCGRTPHCTYLNNKCVIMCGQAGFELRRCTSDLFKSHCDMLPILSSDHTEYCAEKCSLFDENTCEDSDHMYCSYEHKINECQTKCAIANDVQCANNLFSHCSWEDDKGCVPNYSFTSQAM
jgi:hypothetical protein